jgi:hypothetical protein
MSRMIETKALSIHENTGPMARARKTISLALIEVEKTYEHFRVPEEVRRDLNNASTGAEFDFLDAIERMLIARSFFKEHLEIKSSAGMISRIDDTNHVIFGRCYKELESRLMHIGPCVTFTATTEGGATSSTVTAVNPIDADTSAHIVTLLQCLKMDQQDDTVSAFLGLYSSCRAKTLCRLLDKERDAAAGANRPTSSYDRNSPIFAHYLEVLSTGLRGEILLWSSLLKRAELRDRLSDKNGAKEEAYIDICTAVLRRLECFLEPMMRAAAGTGTGAGSARITSTDGNGVTVLQQGNAFMAALGVTTLLEANYTTLRDLCRPDSRDENTASLQLEQIRRTCLQSCMSAIPALINSISRTATMANSEGEGDDADAFEMRPATGHVLVCTRGLEECENEYNTVISLINRTSGLTMAPDVPRSLQLLILQIITTLLQCLLVRHEHESPSAKRRSSNSAYIMNPAASVNLLRTSSVKEPVKDSSSSLSNNIKKSALYESEDFAAVESLLAAQKHLFMLNNLSPLLSAVTDGKFSAEPSETNSKSRWCPEMLTLVSSIKMRVEEEQVNLCAVLINAMGMSRDQMDELAGAGDQSAKSASKGRALKAKFAQFNGATEAILKKKGVWRINSDGVRASTTLVLNRMVVGAYRAFFDKYSSVPFSTKHKDQYLRYEPDSIATLFRSFFD